MLQDDNPACWTIAELARALDSSRVRSAAGKLAAGDVIQQDGERVRASLCARHLDALGLLAV